ncbi:MAG: hypothetical protein GTN64_05565 [Candidatus Latescibacteria bacterium]|nr:hypothetical protein [Candidatus Latescibacterota bacterium]NIO78077.1 hypothetical protein [Candidatus Latescibacterota bacterium]
MNLQSDCVEHYHQDFLSKDLSELAAHITDRDFNHTLAGIKQGPHTLSVQYKWSRVAALLIARYHQQEIDSIENRLEGYIKQEFTEEFLKEVND